MKYIDPEAEHWAQQMYEMLKRWPRQPFQAVPYNAVRGIAWRIMDADERHIAIVFEEEAARLIAARLNM